MEDIEDIGHGVEIFVISLSTSPYPTSPSPLLLFCLSHLFCVIFSVEAVVHREKVEPLPPARRQALWTWAPTWNSDYLDLQSRPGTRRDARRSSRCFLKSFFHRISPKMRNIFWQLNLRNSIHNHYPLCYIHYLLSLNLRNSWFMSIIRASCSNPRPFLGTWQWLKKWQSEHLKGVLIKKDTENQYTIDALG